MRLSTLLEDNITNTFFVNAYPMANEIGDPDFEKMGDFVHEETKDATLVASLIEKHPRVVVHIYVGDINDDTDMDNAPALAHLSFMHGELADMEAIKEVYSMLESKLHQPFDMRFWVNALIWLGRMSV